MSAPVVDYYIPEELAEIAEKRFSTLIRMDRGAVEMLPYYYNLISWMIKWIKLIPDLPLTEEGNYDTMMYDDDRLLGC